MFFLLILSPFQYNRTMLQASRLSAVLFSLHIVSVVAGGIPAGVDKDVFGSQHALRVRRDGEEVLHADVADSDDSRVKRETPTGFFWPGEGGSMGRQQRNDLLSHALRIKKNAGFSHALRVRKWEGDQASGHALRIKKSSPSTLGHALRIKRGGASPLDHAFRIKKGGSALDPAFRIKKGNSALDHAFRIKKDSDFGYGHALRVRKSSNLAAGVADVAEKEEEELVEEEERLLELLNKVAALTKAAEEEEEEEEGEDPYYVKRAGISRAHLLRT